MRIYSFRYLFLGLAVLFLGIFTHSSVSYASNLICPQAMNTNVPLDECEAVVALYDSTDGQNRFINTNRDADTDICTWYGVTCMNIGNQDRVIGIDLSSNNLFGTLPASLADLTELQRFILDFNDLWGTLSSDRSTWTNIHTFSLRGMANNSNMPLIGGSLPSSWSARGNTMQKFTITDNRINGPLPTTRSSRSTIEEFNVYANQIVGQLPQQWNSRSTIKKFNVGGNQLNGSLPSSWLSSWLAIQDFNVGGNQLNGTLSSQLSNRGPTIKYFRVNNNLFSGPLPTQLSTWTHIKVFNMSFNPLNAQLPSAWWTWGGTIEDFSATQSQLIGTLPPSWSAWGSSIKCFGVNINNLMGTLPSSWSSWGGKIEMFSVLQNQLTGPLPRQWHTWGGSIKYFRANHNQIGGSLPPLWSSRSNIKELSLSHNNLVGYLPTSWSSFSALEIFTIDDNKLIGPVPSSWGNNRPNISASGNSFINNCLQTIGYTLLMQSWLNNNINLSPQNIPGFCNFTVNYMATSGGSISGAVVQSIPYGGTGTSVTAVPAPGCVFSQWSDGSTVNPRIATNVTGNMTFTGSFICNTLPVNASGNIVPAISFWYGKVNQYFNTGSMSRQTDPTGTRGGGSSTQRGANGWGDRPLAYCRLFYPSTVSVQGIGLVTIHTWMAMGNTMPWYTGTKKAYQCVQAQPIGQSGNPLPNRYSAPTVTVPTSRDGVPIVNTVAPVMPSIPQDRGTIVSPITQQSPLATDKSISTIPEVVTIISDNSKPTVDVSSPSLVEQKSIVPDTFIVPASKEISPLADTVIVAPIVEAGVIVNDETIMQTKK